MYFISLWAKAEVVSLTHNWNGINAGKAVKGVYNIFITGPLKYEGNNLTCSVESILLLYFFLFSVTGQARLFLSYMKLLKFNE